MSKTKNRHIVNVVSGKQAMIPAPESTSPKTEIRDIEIALANAEYALQTASTGTRNANEKEIIELLDTLIAQANTRTALTVARLAHLLAQTMPKLKKVSARADFAFARKYGIAVPDAVTERWLTQRLRRNLGKLENLLLPTFPKIGRVPV